MALFAHLRAGRAVERGGRLLDDGKLDEAAVCYRQAAELAPQWSVPWFNLGLVYKFQRRWGESLTCNKRAVELNASDEGARWNLGLAATAVGDWRTARAVWRNIGLQFPDEDGFVDCKMGLVPVRLDPAGVGEVVWCHRLDPARAQIDNVPLPESKRRYHDILLHDGEARGERLLRGQKVPVFNELAVLQPSEYATFKVEVRAPRFDDDLDELSKLLFARELAVEDWTANVRRLCNACSEGSPGKHEHDRDADRWRRFGIAARDEAAVRDALEAWRAVHDGRIFDGLERVL